MSRSPFAYPLRRSVDNDAGGAADLQTDIMRFMAILALCLMAIFALVQSIPLAPVTPAEPVADETAIVEPEATQAQALVVTRPKHEPRPAREAAEPDPVLTRPERTPKYTPAQVAEPVVAASSRDMSPQDAPPAVVDTPEQQQGFTLRFESDQALMRLVAASQVGLYAIADDRAQRMTVNASRISFWDASTPNAFHEMETRTVPAAVVNALARSGASTESVAWGVTLPGKLRTQLDQLMRNNTGGSLVIGADGNMRLEAS